MKKTTVAVLAGTAALAALLWFLPRGSVQQSAAAADSAKAAKAVATDTDTRAEKVADTTDVHTLQLSAAELADLQTLRKQLSLAKTPAKQALADSLAQYFIRRGSFDSALVYREKALALGQTEASLFAAAEAAYMAFSVATSPAKQAGFATKAQQYYQQVLAQNANRLDAKTHLALTYVSGPTPMQGVRLLREVVSKDPENQEALYQLGILSLQSGQYDKAVGRFLQILAKHPDDTKSRFYLGLAYKELGQPAKARQELERVQTTDPDPAVQATVRDYLAELKIP